MWDIKTCCGKLFLYLTYPSFSNVVSAEVGVTWEYAVANRFLQTYIPFFDSAMQSVLRYASQGELCWRRLFFTSIYPPLFIQLVLGYASIGRCRMEACWVYYIHIESRKGLHLVLSTGCSPLFIVLRLGRWLGLLWMVFSLVLLCLVLGPLY